VYITLRRDDAQVRLPSLLRRIAVGLPPFRNQGINGKTMAFLLGWLPRLLGPRNSSGIPARELPA
jgi:hypothetical protein